MQLHTLKPAKGSVKKAKRLGRGEASGKGGTATKGTKGHQSRSGFKNKKAHEGGQMPIQRRVPKRGFKNPGRVAYKVFNLGQVDALVEKYGLQEFSVENLYVNSLIARTDAVKILGQGTLKAKTLFKVHAVSASAQKAIEEAGGTVELVK